MLRRFFKENFWYLIAIGVALSILFITLYIVFGMRSIEVARAQNAARASSLSSSIEALPKVSSISPSQTSGILDYISTSRLKLASEIDEAYRPQFSPWMYGLLPEFYGKSSQQSLHTQLAKESSSILAKTGDDLEKLKKIIEYMPLVDLGGNFADDPGLGDRLRRTQQGLTDTIAYIQMSDFPHKAELMIQLTALNARTLSLTDQTKTAWAAEVLEVQKLLISDIETRDIQQSKLPEQLQTVSQTY